MLTRYPALDSILDLQFHPVVNDRPRAFTRAQIDEFNEQGFIGPVPLLSGHELEQVQRWFRDNDATMQEMRKKATGFISMHHVLPGLYDIVTHPRTVGFLNDLMGPNVICHTTEFVNKPPKQTQGGSHHQDATFNAIDARCVIVWLAIADADAENGCMWFVPGSHKRGVVECNSSHFVVDPHSYGREIPMEVRAGHALFMSDLLMHSSPANRSETRYRPAITGSYAPAEVRPHENLNRWAVLCSGADVDGHWKPQPRPAGPRLFA